MKAKLQGRQAWNALCSREPGAEAGRRGSALFTPGLLWGTAASIVIFSVMLRIEVDTLSLQGQISPQPFIR